MSILLTLQESYMWNALSLMCNNSFDSEFLKKPVNIDNLNELIESADNIVLFYTPLEMLIEETVLNAEVMQDKVEQWYNTNQRFFTELTTNKSKIVVEDLSQINSRDGAHHYHRKYGLVYTKQDSNSNPLKKLLTKAMLGCFKKECELDEKIKKEISPSLRPEGDLISSLISMYDLELKHRKKKFDDTKKNLSSDLEALIYMEKKELREEVIELRTSLSKSLTSLNTILNKHNHKIADIKRSKRFAIEKVQREMVLAELNHSKWKIDNKLTLKNMLTKNFLIFRKVFNKRMSVKLNRDLEILKNSSLFDPNYYLKNNNDVKLSNVNPHKHYLKTGYLEGRKPSKKFDGCRYLLLNRDIIKTGMNPLVHYIRFGKPEGRKI